jgi:hypothetical protein
VSVEIDREWVRPLSTVAGDRGTSSTGTLSRGARVA